MCTATEAISSDGTSSTRLLRRPTGLLATTRANEHGIALLTVLVAMMIISIMLFEFQYGSMVERQLAYNDLNQLRAYYLAKSGIRIGLLRVGLYGRLKRSPELKNMAKGLPLDNYLDMIWNLPLPGFPPSKSGLDKLLKADKDAAEKTLAQTRVEDGISTHVITNESSKINLNYLVVPAQFRNDRLSFTGTPRGMFDYVARLLANLLNDFIKASENPNEEYRNMRPEELVSDIMDWVNPGGQRFLGGQKDSFYEGLVPPYKAKRNKFYTVNELKQVKGIDDHLFEKLRPFVTVYSYGGRVNINTAGNDLLKALYPDFTEADLKRLQEEKARLGSWSTEQQFVDFIAGTLGRGNFKSIYNDANSYPFTVGAQSFIVEAMGTINRSRVQIQRTIRVAVALAPGKGGSVDTSITNQTACNVPGKFWDQRDNKCRSKPGSQQECQDLAGNWSQQGGQFCCSINVPNNIIQVCLTPQDQNVAKDLNSMRILYWSEL